MWFRSEGWCHASLPISCPPTEMQLLLYERSVWVCPKPSHTSMCMCRFLDSLHSFVKFYLFIFCTFHAPFQDNIGMLKNCFNISVFLKLVDSGGQTFEQLRNCFIFYFNSFYTVQVKFCWLTDSNVHNYKTLNSVVQQWSIKLLL